MPKIKLLTENHTAQAVEIRTFMIEKLDAIDIKILKVLQQNAKLTTKELAEAVHLSASPTFERQKRLEREGYIKKYQVIDDGTQGIIRITLKYLPGKEKAIQGLRRVSKPGLRVYAGADELPRVLKGLGIAIISTSKGVMTDKQARKEHVGGEVLAFVW